MVSQVSASTLSEARAGADRRNARKSTGPRSARGKQAVILNGLQHGRRSRCFLDTLGRATLRQQLEFARLYASLYYALAPEACEIAWVMSLAARVWRRKQAIERQVRTSGFRAELAAPQGLTAPMLFRSVLDPV